MKCLSIGLLVRVIWSETQMDSWPWCVSVCVRAGVSTMARSCSHCNWQVVCVTAEVKWHHWHERSKCKWHRTCGKVPEHSAQTRRTKYSQGIHGFSSCLRRFSNDNSVGSICKPFFYASYSFTGFCRKGAVTLQTAFHSRIFPCVSSRCVMRPDWCSSCAADWMMSLLATAVSQSMRSRSQMRFHICTARFSGNLTYNGLRAHHVPSNLLNMCKQLKHLHLSV